MVYRVYDSSVVQICMCDINYVVYLGGQEVYVCMYTNYKTVWYTAYDSSGIKIYEYGKKR